MKPNWFLLEQLLEGEPPKGYVPEIMPPGWHLVRRKGNPFPDGTPSGFAIKHVDHTGKPLRRGAVECRWYTRHPQDKKDPTWKDPHWHHYDDPCAPVYVRSSPLTVYTHNGMVNYLKKLYSTLHQMEPLPEAILKIEWEVEYAG